MVEAAPSQRAVAGPISGFVQRGELMLERVRVLVENSNLKGVRREALKMKSMSAKLANRRLIALAEDLATHAEHANAAARRARRGTSPSLGTGAADATHGRPPCRRRPPCTPQLQGRPR